MSSFPRRGFGLSPEDRAFEALAERLAQALNESSEREESGPRKNQLIIGIDFGTTYTGVAYAHTASTIESRSSALTVEQTCEQIVPVNDWPSVDPLYPDKIRTILAYQDGQVAAWGGAVKPSHPIQIAFFKLGLQDTINDGYKGAETRLEGFLKDANYRHPNLPNKTAVDFAADFLKAVTDHVVKITLPNRVSENFMDNQAIRYVITVPAIWTDKAKSLTKLAAAKAGIAEKDLDMVTEPEAAALLCSTLSQSVDLNNGDRFLICDAGGGTVDLISYEIISKDPFRIKECTGGTGGVCGALFLTRNFEDFLQQRLGSRVKLSEKALAQAIKTFESAIKFHFNPYSDDCEDEYEIPIRGRDIPNIPEIGLEDGTLNISRNEIMQRIFLPVFSKIGELVQSQIKQVGNIGGPGVKVIFLVGGLGSNAFLRDYLKSRLRKDLIIKQPAKGATAIVRGAVLHRLGLKVSERHVRRHYGLVCARPFRIGDPVQYLTVGNEGTPWCRNVMRWFVNKGDSIKNGHVVQYTFYSEDFTDEDWQQDKVMMTRQLLYCDEDEAPEFRTPKVYQLCKLEVDAKMLPPAAIEKKLSPLGFTYYEIKHQIAIEFGTGLEFKVMYDKEVLGTVEAQYD